MIHYIAYLDVLGAKNSSEKEDFEYYLRIISNFQTELLRASDLLEDGRIHFFSDCAFIESRNLVSLINCIRTLRDFLFDSKPTFIRGAITLGILGAITGNETKEFIQEYYGDENITKRFLSIKNSLKKNQEEEKVKGTLFLSKDIANLVQYETSLKGAGIYLDDKIISKLENLGGINFVKSGYIVDINKREYKSFNDISYIEDEITIEFIDKLLKTYYKSNIYDVNYGRYYLSVLISCINSTNFSRLEFNEDSDTFNNAKPVFLKILNLKKEHSDLYNYTKGLEFVYFSLINKVYFDIEKNNKTTKSFLKKIMFNNKHLQVYRNKISRIPTSLIDIKVKNMMLQDFGNIVEDYE